MSAPLLVELLTEELPPKALKSLGDSFASTLQDELAKREFLEVDSKVEMFATPRRLAARISNVREKSPDRQYEERLLPEKVGFDAAGKPTPALLKKLASLGRDDSAVASIRKANDGKLVMLYLPQMASGQSLLVGLMSALEEAIEKLPIPKVMTYQLSDGITTVKFVRPAHGLVALHGREVVTVSVLGLEAGRLTHGHRFLGARDIELKHTDEYETRLKGEGKVIANFGVRRTEIDVQLKARAAEAGGLLGDYESLLDEVTALVEWPVVYVASFEPEFLAVPQECLILTMRTNQRYFPLFDHAGKLTEKFLVVSNMQVADPANIIDGNRRVVRPRLADARFFYDQDRKTRLETRVPQLGNVVYHNKLGTQLERVQRIQLLAGQIARMIGADAALAERAAWLAKADLLTGMVGEFPELQGIMGSYYALHDSEPMAVVRALADQYKLRVADTGETLESPEDLTSACLYLADRIETLVGMFGVGSMPTGDKDPYGLRRAALGIISVYQLLVAAFSNKQTLPDVRELIEFTANLFPTGRLAKDVISEVHEFILDRYWYQLVTFHAKDAVEAVISQRPPFVEISERVKAVEQFRRLPEAEALAVANKRIRNILRQAKAPFDAAADPKLLKEDAERALYREIVNTRQVVDAKFAVYQYTESLVALAHLRSFVDQFFDEVMVNVEDLAVRQNRLRLLGELDYIMNRVADISKLAT